MKMKLNKLKNNNNNNFYQIFPFYIIFSYLIIVNTNVVLSLTTSPRHSHGNALVGSNLYILGGNNSNEAFYVDLSSSFDVNSPPWITLPTIGGKSERSSISTGGQDLKTIYVIGGYQYTSNYRSNIGSSNNLVYTFDTSYGSYGSWDSVTDSSLVRRSRAYSVVDSYGYIYIFGGSDSSIRMDNMSIFDSIENSVNEISFTNGPAPRPDYTATLFDNYIVYIGGVEGILTSSSSSKLVDINAILVFDTSSSTWNTFQATGPDIGSRMGHTATLGSDGKIFVYGGITLSSLNPIVYFAVLDITSLPYQWSTPELKDENNGPPDQCTLSYNTATFYNKHLFLAFGNISSSIYDTTTSSRLYVMNTENYSWVSSYPQKKSKAPLIGGILGALFALIRILIFLCWKRRQKSKAPLIGGILGALFALIGILIFIYWKRRQRQKNEKSESIENIGVVDVHANEVIESSPPTQPFNRPSSIKNLTSEEHRDDIIILSESVVYPEKNIDKYNLEDFNNSPVPPLDPSITSPYNTSDAPAISNTTDVPPPIVYNTTDAATAAAILSSTATAAAILSLARIPSSAGIPSSTVILSSKSTAIPSSTAILSSSAATAIPSLATAISKSSMIIININYHVHVYCNNIIEKFNPGKCSKCHQDNTGKIWCHPCNSKQFQNELGKWTSGDREIDSFIQQIQLNANKFQEIIEWIPFDRLENVTYLAKGGFGTVYKATWLDGFIKFGKQDVWYRNGEQSVCLKRLGNSTTKNDFLQEIKNQLKFRGKNSIAIYGTTKNPTENEYMIVMNYAKYGSLREVLNNEFKKLTWWRKSFILSSIANGLKNIHEMGLIHKDFHSVFGIIPYMAPETLSRGEYTQASDIYSFGMVMLEVLTSYPYPPFYNIPHDANLVMKICDGHKPEIKCEIPQTLKEIMEKCWNFESFNRPTAEELRFQLFKFCYNDKNGEIRKQVRKQIKAANKSNKNFIQYDPNVMHPEAIYTSRHLPFLKSKKFETHVTKQWDFVIPDIIIEENEIREN
ncbi:hypothetical protein Glove_13g128 [Diversispora epigaea]|uniref:Protein kinase domain-containing protein n=1 Tax=Diversispora epigaea TaxID=1348612 RepID=A0A397JYQ9_9GLOM|nr:hypothetical protein Glove_13g128 [Diversispora epigaea]